MEKIKLPKTRASRAGQKLEVQKPNTYGFGLKIAVRNAAKNLAAYHTSIDCDICGRSDVGEEIPINTIGRWIFGTPGYMGHAIFEGGNINSIVIWLPVGTPQVVSDLLIAACNIL